MKTATKIILVINLFFVLHFVAKAQTNTTGGVSIVQGSVPPHESSMLDVVSTNKGVLIPRMTTIQRNQITPLTEGLLVYDTDLNTFFFVDINAGTACWKMLDSHKQDSRAGSEACNESDGKIPVGGIIMFSNVTNVTTYAVNFTNGVGNGKYLGWFVCDGRTHTVAGNSVTVPNMIDKFVTGIVTTSTNPGTTGGAKQVTLDISKMPSHTHTITASSMDVTVPAHLHPITDMKHSHTFPALNGTKGGMADQGGKDDTPSSYSTSESYTGITTTGLSAAFKGTLDALPTAAATGGGSAFDILPPYYTVVYIIRLY